VGVSIIHRTTLTPSKLELLTPWLPSRPWYREAGKAPELAKAGGFRLDDPAGEVGIEFMVVRCGDGDEAIAYHVPLTYRGAPLAGAEDALIGTAEHGVLGHRWFYDATRDPLFAAELAALLRGQAEPQAQSVNDTPDPTVLVTPVPGTDEMPAGATVPQEFPVSQDFTASDDTDGTLLRIGVLAVRVHRALEPVDGTAPRPGQVTAAWRLPGDAQVRGLFVTAELAAS
jgi:hypothetical protein